MKKIYKNMLSIGAGLAITSSVSAQVITESFDDITTLAASGWVTNNLSTPVGTTTDWIQGTATNPFAPNSGTGFISGNFNMVAGTGDISCWLITPARTFNNGDVVTFYSRTVDVPAYADRMQVRLSVNGTSTNVGTTASSVGDFSTLLLDINPTLILTGAGSYPNVWTKYTLTVSGLPMAMTGRMAFRYYVTNSGPTGTNGDNIGIDDFTYAPAGSGADVIVANNPIPYTIVPLTQVVAIPMESTVTNNGVAATTDATLTANVYKAPNFTTPVFTATSAVVSLAISGSAVINAGTFTPTTTGNYMVQYISSCTNNTATAADTSSYTFMVSNGEYARDNGNVFTAFGIGAGPTGYLGTMFTVNTATYIDSVLVGLNKPGSGNSSGDGVGDSTKVVIYDFAAGLPNAIIGTSDNYVFTPADTLGLVLRTHAIKAIGGAKLMLQPGNYLVAITEYNTNVGLAVTNDIFTPNTAFASWTGQAWTPVENFGANFAKSHVIRPNLTSCSFSSSVQTLALCAGQSTTVGNNNYTTTGTYTDTLTTVSGCDSIVTTNLTVGTVIDVTTTVNQDSVVANATGATYQWINCTMGDSAIAGATNASYIATESGSYAVIVTVANCSDTSTCVSLTPVGLSAKNNVQSITINPNPSTGIFVINANITTQVIITDALGRVIMTNTINASKQTIDLSNEANGIYFVKTITNQGQSVQRLAISK